MKEKNVEQYCIVCRKNNLILLNERKKFHKEYYHLFCKMVHIKQISDESIEQSDSNEEEEQIEDNGICGICKEKGRSKYLKSCELCSNVFHAICGYFEGYYVELIDWREQTFQ